MVLIVDFYVHFSSFVPFKVKGNLISCTVNKSRKMCTENTIDGKLRFSQVFRQNGHSGRFTDETLEQSEERYKKATIEK